MRAAELIAPLTFRLIDMPIEDLGPGEVQGSRLWGCAGLICTLLPGARSAALPMSIRWCLGVSPQAGS
jgi:hypothetical protein